jgi:LL-diaminopimelate aminotransferase
MTGWRLGVAVGNREVVSALGSVKSNYDTGLFPAVQLAGIAALTGDQSCVEAMRQCYQKRRNIFVEGLNEIGFVVGKPKGSFYVWAPIPGGMSSREFCSTLLDEAGVVVTPGAGFGRFGEGYFRAALTVDESQLQEAVERFRKIIV